MKIYLDNCSFNRPFDDQSLMRIKLETEAKLFIQENILVGKLQLIWSYILEYENIQNPFVERRNAIIEWKAIAIENIGSNEDIITRASEFAQHGVKSKDALHIACAIEANAEYFLSTDDKLIKKFAKIKDIVVTNPVTFIPLLENLL